MQQVNFAWHKPIPIGVLVDRYIKETMMPAVIESVFQVSPIMAYLKGTYVAPKYDIWKHGYQNNFNFSLALENPELICKYCNEAHDDECYEDR